MTIAEQMRREGEATGRLKERADVLIKLLTLKFGSVTDGCRARIVAASPENLDIWIGRVLAANTLDAVFGE